jgi:hypothetical protein
MIRVFLLILCHFFILGDFSSCLGIFILTELSKIQFELNLISMFTLYRYGFVVHTCIDVYSRYITYLDVSNNNNPSTVLRLFESGVTELGLPARVKYIIFEWLWIISCVNYQSLIFSRCDNGLENVGVTHFMDINRPLVSDRMVYQRGPGRLHNVLIKVGIWLGRFIDLFE